MNNDSMLEADREPRRPYQRPTLSKRAVLTRITALKTVSSASS